MGTTVPYPEIEPHAEGDLDVGDGQRLHWEVSGSPAGRPAVVLHGGPGSGSSPWWRRLFDPGAYRIVVFDQRGCGRSTPHASDPAVSLEANTTHHLIADIERLRSHLGVEAWLVLGGSWGSTLALAYAQRFPQRITGIVLVGVTVTRRTDIDWLYRGVAPLFPEQWERFLAGAGLTSAAHGGDMVEAYHRLLRDDRAEVREKAADDFTAWELSLLSADLDAAPPPAFADPAYRYGRARIVTHYFRHAAWLEEGALLRDAGRLAGIPGVLVHGRLDLGGPLVSAWELHRAWPDSELVVVQRAGHSASDPGMTEQVVAATDRFAGAPVSGP